MNIKIVRLQNISYLAPAVFSFDTGQTHDDYESYCGAGKGLGDTIVPETMYGMRISHICHIHDVSWEVSDGGLSDFAISNAMFLFNLIIFVTRKSNILLRYARACRCVTYFKAVNKIGWPIYKSLHDKD